MTFDLYDKNCSPTLLDLTSGRLFSIGINIWPLTSRGQHLTFHAKIFILWRCGSVSDDCYYDWLSQNHFILHFSIMESPFHFNELFDSVFFNLITNFWQILCLLMFIIILSRKLAPYLGEFSTDFVHIFRIGYVGGGKCIANSGDHWTGHLTDRWPWPQNSLLFNSSRVSNRFCSNFQDRSGLRWGSAVRSLETIGLVVWPVGDLWTLWSKLLPYTTGVLFDLWLTNDLWGQHLTFDP